MAARCTDPTCSCRSPELARFTDQVLRRDGAKTDYLVIPLIAGVLANCFIAEAAIDRAGSEVNAGLVADSHAIRELAADANAGVAWDDGHAYGIIANLTFCNWPGLLTWGSISFYRMSVGLQWQSNPTQDLAATVRFLYGPAAPSISESVIIATIAASSASRRGGKDFDLLGKVGRTLRVALADRLRRAQLTTWPAVLSAAVGDWTLPTLQSLAYHQSKSGDAAIHYVSALADEEKESAGETESDESAAVEETRAPETTDGESEAAAELVEGAIAEINHWRAQRDRVQRERDNLADRDARHRSHIESLEREVQSARRSQARLEGEVIRLRQESEQLSERLAGYEAVADHAEVPVAADSFAGRHVLLFTGAENAAARAAFEQSFRDLGAAEVSCYFADRSRGPDRFPGDAIVAIDITFMGHSTWSAIRDQARGTGTWCYWGKHGAASLARATAAAWKRHLASVK